MSKRSEAAISLLKMAEPALRKRGLNLYEKGPETFMLESKSGSSFYYQVSSERNEDIIYEVSLNLQSKTSYCVCRCTAFESYGSCKHIIGSLIDFLIFEDKDNPFVDVEDVLEVLENEPQEKEVVIEIPTLPPTEPLWKSFITKPGIIWQFLSWHVQQERFNRLQQARTILIEHNKEKAYWKFEYKGTKKEVYHAEIDYDGIETFRYRCGCSYNGQMCAHIAAAFDLLHIGDNQVFAKYRNYDNEKSAALAQYGLTLADEEAKHFQFTKDYYGNLVTHAPSWILKPNDKAALLNFKSLLAPLKDGKKALSKPVLAAGQIMDFRLGFLLNFNSQKFNPGFEFEVFKIYSAPEAAKKNYKKLNIHERENLAFLRNLPDDVYEIIESLTEEKMKLHLKELGYGFVMNYAAPFAQLSGKSLQALKEHYITRLQKLWPWLAEQPEVFILMEGKFSNTNLVPVSIQMPLVKLTARLLEDQRFITLKILPEVDAEPISAAPVKLYNDFVFWGDGKAWAIEQLADCETLAAIPRGVLIIPVSEKLAFIKNLLPGLQQRFQLQVPASFDIATSAPEPQPQILVKEYTNQYLMLQPQFVYGGEMVDFERQPEDILLTMPDGSMQLIERNRAAENDFYTGLKLLHPLFKSQQQNDFYYLPFADVMKNNWFLDTVKQLQENNVPVLGIQELKKFKYNINKPKWEMKAGSGIDWFELKIEVSFGDQLVALKDIRKALLNRQNTVLLGDGSFGLLPEEWLKQYGMLLKMGDEQKSGVLRVSKLHFTLIEELHNELDDEAILAELNLKKEKLSKVNSIEAVAHSKAITANLRPYQVSGFNWLHTLDELGWGGCLADDMGLGKTLQAITFLQYVKEKYSGSTHLIVCPTSLIYNWENELKKFALQLGYHIYYGKDREFSNEHFDDYDLVITSYGIVRSDLQDLLKFQWHYVLLDESQAIKNPEAQTTKAVQLLKSKNRIILSGTPVQNNTYDLYAQFQFINPGLLGNREFFKTEFANPIDKNNDAEKSAALRKLVYPFLLRRTKEQVAPDLPDKTEMTLWCEMGKEQRNVYNDYKNYYRNALLKKIEEVGMAKAGIYVLEGLLRLRQICDSPQLVKSEDVTTHESAKIEELLREIKENTGSHKLLVFSQFTEMLALLQIAMQKEGIAYSYLDGSTPAIKRQEAVDAFQNDEKVKLFLISLKAGGVGLNLTAANYVYIVDPWWNPAVEQQAIDRTHRIGQTRKIFAYRMICKDTVEEKIMELQQRKKQLANDLITEDAGFVKKLTQEDIAFLFS